MRLGSRFLPRRVFVDGHSVPSTALLNGFLAQFRTLGWRVAGLTPWSDISPVLGGARSGSYDDAWVSDPAPSGGGLIRVWPRVPPGTPTLAMARGAHRLLVVAEYDFGLDPTRGGERFRHDTARIEHSGAFDMSLYIGVLPDPVPWVVYEDFDALLTTRRALRNSPFPGMLGIDRPEVVPELSDERVGVVTVQSQGTSQLLG